MPYAKYNLYYKSNIRPPRRSAYRKRKKNGTTSVSKKQCTNNEIHRQIITNETTNTFDEIQALTESQPQITQSHQATIIHDDYEQNQIQYINHTEDEEEAQISEDLLCQTLVSLSYAANLTHSALSLVAEFTQLVSNQNNLPKKFRDLMTRVTNESVNYTKTWFCQKCLVEITLSKKSQRECERCSTR